MTDNFKEKASGVFPNAKWTGGSSIHASIAFGGNVDIPFDKPRLLLKALIENEFPAFMQRVFIKQCPGMEWVLSGDEFGDLIMVDFYRLLKGMSTQETKHRLKNPSTGNYFHRITLLEDQAIVGGVRVWVYSNDDESVSVNFRWRLEEMVEEADKVRKKVRIKAEATVQEVMEVKEYVATEKEASPMMQLENFEK